MGNVNITLQRARRPYLPGVTRPYQHILYERKPPFAYVTLNRPAKMNAISWIMRSELTDALGEAGWDDDEIRVIILKGAGDNFCAGWDLVDPTRPPRPEPGNAPERVWGIKVGHELLWSVVWDNPKPIIAQIQGFCLAAGMAFSSQSDLRICSEDALFGYPIVREGGPFLAVISPYVMGITKARELLYTGNLMDAAEAYRVGFLNKVVPRDKLEEEVNKIARTISKLPIYSVRASKRAINTVYELMHIKMAHDVGDELEGLPTMVPEGAAPEAAALQNMLKKASGLKDFVDARAARFAEEDAWWKERRKRK